MDQLYIGLRGDVPLHDTRAEEIAAQSGKPLDKLGYRINKKRQFSGSLFDVVLARILKDRVEKGLKLNRRERHFMVSAYVHFGLLAQAGLVEASEGLEKFSKDASLAIQAKKRAFNEMADASLELMPVAAHKCSCGRKKEMTDEYFDNWDTLPHAEKGWTNRPDWLTEKDIAFRVSTIERWELSDREVKRDSSRLRAEASAVHAGACLGNDACKGNGTCVH